jgi:hypothetical protein
LIGSGDETVAPVLAGLKQTRRDYSDEDVYGPDTGSEGVVNDLTGGIQVSGVASRMQTVLQIFNAARVLDFIVGVVANVFLTGLADSVGEAQVSEREGLALELLTVHAPTQHLGCSAPVSIQIGPYAALIGGLKEQH